MAKVTHWNDAVTGATRKVGLIGHPVEHSLSPLMHNRAFQRLGMDWIYTAWDVEPKRLGPALKALVELGFEGFNVTVPHKPGVYRRVDELSERGRRAGAVNTVIVREGKLLGDNTDGDGYVRSLRTELNWRPTGKRVVCLGAGGAARGVLMALAAASAKELRIVNLLSPSGERRRAEALAQSIRDEFPRLPVSLHPWEKGIETEVFDGAGLLVNTSVCGMKGMPPVPFALKDLPDKAVVSDIVYDPPVTGLHRKAQRRGLRTHGGLGMLLHQGAIAFNLWTGKTFPVQEAYAWLEAARKKKK